MKKRNRAHSLHIRVPAFLEPFVPRISTRAAVSLPQLVRPVLGLTAVTVAFAAPASAATGSTATPQPTVAASTSALPAAASQTSATTPAASTQRGGAKVAAAPTGMAARYASVPRQSIGIVAPRNPDTISDDDHAIAYAIKHGTSAERREIAQAIEARYPLDAVFGPHKCVAGRGSLPIWAVNFANAAAPLYVEFDGTPYARATVQARAHGYAALSVTNGSHLIKVYGGGKVLATTTTSFTCASTSAKTVKAAVKPAASPASAPRPRTSSVQTAAPAHRTAPAQQHVPAPQGHRPHKQPVTHVATPQVPATHTHGQDAPGRKPAHPHHARTHVAPKALVTHEGPRVQTDAVMASTSSKSVPGMAVVAVTLVAGAVLVGRRLRGFFA